MWDVGPELGIKFISLYTLHATTVVDKYISCGNDFDPGIGPKD